MESLAQAFACVLSNYRRASALTFTPFLVPVMASSSARLLWLTNEVRLGRVAHASFSHNPAKQTEKVKFVLEDGYDCCGAYRPCLLGALAAARTACDTSITTDKGHRCSKGNTVIEFWMRQPGGASYVEGVALPPPPPPLLAAAGEDTPQLLIDPTDVLDEILPEYLSVPSINWQYAEIITVRLAESSGGVAADDPEPSEAVSDALAQEEDNLSSWTNSEVMLHLTPYDPDDMDNAEEVVRSATIFIRHSGTLSQNRRVLEALVAYYPGNAEVIALQNELQAAEAAITTNELQEVRIAMADALLALQVNRRS